MDSGWVHAGTGEDAEVGTDRIVTEFPCHEGIPGKHSSGLFVADRRYQKLKDQWRYRVRQGTAVTVYPGCFLDTDTWNRSYLSEKYRLTVMAAALKNRSRFLMSEAATVLHGLPLPHTIFPIELGTPTNHRNFKMAGPLLDRKVLARQREVPPEGLVRVNGIASMTVGRGVVGVVGNVGKHGGIAPGLMAVEGALRRGVPPAELLECATDAMGRFRDPRSKEILSWADERSDTPLESFAKAAFIEAGLPRFYQQVHLADEDGTFAGVVDFYFPETKLVVEADGRGKYKKKDQADYRVVMKERERQVRIENRGNRVVRIHWDEVDDGRAVRMVWNAINSLRAHPREPQGTVRLAQKYKNHDGNYRWG